ncbi:MAG: heparinase II/III family protein [Planctomycetota bacterium]|nr:heparinase II/III family protein [Planctomycetota bacterium]
MPRPLRRLLLATSLLWAAATSPAAADLPPHPRLFLTPAAVAAIERRAAADPLLKNIRQAVLAKAERLRKDRTVEYRIPDGKRLLRESRRAIDTITHTAMAWRITRRQADFDRCVAELDAACELPDWNPAHFLDTAEMATAVALGLDWLWDDLDQPRRQRYREALLTKAIEPWEQGVAENIWWATVRNNWTQVCAGGIATAAAVMAETPEDLAAGPFGRCLDTLARCGRFYEPDGGYPEGPGYADYGTAYHVLGLAAAEAMGRPIEVPAVLAVNNRFMAHLFGPTGWSFNFADGPVRRPVSIPARGWLAARPADPAIQAVIRRRLAGIAASGSNDRFFPLHLLWLPGEPAAPGQLPLAAAYRGEQPLVLFRTAWDDPEATFVAAKGGTPAASHGHMDVGSFVLDALGQRWVHDLGSDDYNLPGYFDFRGGRWRYYRLNARSHCVPLLAGHQQAADAACCPLIDIDLGGEPRGIFDLTAAYTFKGIPAAGRMTREVRLDPISSVVTIRDRIAAADGPVRWQAMINATATLDGSRATLRLAEAEMAVAVEPATAAWKLEPATPPSDQERPNAGFQLLVAEVPPQPDLEIVVRFTPVREP